MEKRINEFREKRERRYNELKSKSKNELFEMVNRMTNIVGGFDKRSTKEDLVYGILDIELRIPARWEKYF